MAHPGVPSSMTTVPSGYHKEKEPIEVCLLSPVSVDFRQRPACEVNTSHTEAPCWIRGTPPIRSSEFPRFNLCEFILDLGDGKLFYHPNCYAARMYYSLELPSNNTIRSLEYLKVGYNRLSKTQWWRLEGVLPIDIVYEIHGSVDRLAISSYNNGCPDTKKMLSKLKTHFKVQSSQ